MDNLWVVLVRDNDSVIKILGVISEPPIDKVLEYFASRYGVRRREILAFAANYEKYRMCAEPNCLQTTISLAEKYCYLHEEKHKYDNVDEESEEEAEKRSWKKNLNKGDKHV